MDKTNRSIFLFSGFRRTILLFLVILASCSEKEIFSEYRSISQAEWDKNDILEFEVYIKDTEALYDVFLELRNNNDYSFRNIWLFIDYQTPSGEIRSDTLNADLADIYGKWYGKGISLYTYTFPYGLNVQYKDTGNYTYTIRQGMRENPLKGISDVGLRVSKQGNQ
ncbi:MAG: gliding motility lipoprotein GldH [Bacteroidales bacterium]|nr:gliding motility lipoprotein GldH [Bacteroidales bacterium]